VSRAGRRTEDLLLRAAAWALTIGAPRAGTPVVTSGTMPGAAGGGIWALPYSFPRDSRLPRCSGHERFTAACRGCVDELSEAAEAGTMPSLDGPDPAGP
jgi:hypothetical protein